MGTWPRSWSSKRVTSLAAAALGAALAAALVARRRAGSRAARPLAASPAPTPPFEDAHEVAPAPVFTEPAAATSVADVADVTDVDDGSPRDRPARHPGAVEPDAGPPPPAGGRGRTGTVAVGLVLLVAAAGLGWVILGGDDDRPEAVGVEPTAPATPTSTTAIDHDSPHEAFARAADHLVAAGSFAYAGTTTAIDVSHVRPGLWLAVDLTVEGEVMTSAGRVHEIAVDGDGRASETITEGPVVWGRLATSREALPEAGYLSITEESGGTGAGKGAALLPGWLDSTVDRRDAGTDAFGHRLLRATLPASVLGETVDGRPAGDADVVLTLDATGDPVHVEVTSVPTGPPLRLALDITGIGEPVVIDVPVR
jgi:hypothetical protein